MLSMDLIQQASDFLDHKIRQTPLEYSPLLSEAWQAPVYLKLENLQITGSFKVRGALFSLAQLSAQQKQNGVITCSAGNHGKALAFAGKQLHVPVQVFVPNNVDASKYQGMCDLGAQVTVTDFASYDETERFAISTAQSQQIPFISPYDDYPVMAANGGSLAQEVLKQCPEAQHFILPVGGGGMIAGFAYYIKQCDPDSKITASQLHSCPALALSLAKNQAMTDMPYVETLAGGLEGGIGSHCFNVMKNLIDEVDLVKEQAIKDAVTWLLDKHQYLIEPSAAVTLATCLNNTRKNHNPTVIILSGRNVSLDTLKLIL